MPHDYAKKNRTPTKRARGSQPRSSSPAKKSGKSPEPRRAPAPRHSQAGGLSLKWILSLAAVGGFIGFIVYLNSFPVSEGPVQPTAGQKQQQPQPPADQPRDGTGFRFYDILPDSEVIPPRVEEYTPGPTEQNFDYLVQAGSFRSREDAERQRAQIAFQGLRAKVDRIDLDSGSTWYRVNVGPFTSRSQMNAAIDRLVAISIQPLVRRIPKDQG
ncbi:SPOR domain-containing protein [Marinobacter sp.]|uniref:SPOR domain-containing protein n=1 Tax=Marinobacter sp. TaxID=50741 RepID=UPI00384AC9B9